MDHLADCALSKGKCLFLIGIRLIAAPQHPVTHRQPRLLGTGLEIGIFLRCRPLEGVCLALIRCLYLTDMDHLCLTVADLQRHIVRELSRQLLRQTIILIDMLDIRLRHAHRVDRRLRQTPKILGCCPVHRRPLL